MQGSSNRVLRSLSVLAAGGATLSCCAFAQGQPVHPVPAPSSSAASIAKKAPSALLPPVSFSNEVVPILTRFGCNQGTCHGAQYGKGGFKLSLAGFDPDLDFANIAKQARGR